MMDIYSAKGYSEKALVERLQNGERKAFAELYDQFGRSLYALIFEILRSEVDTENLLQDTFVKIWRNIGRYDASKGRLYTWLTTIARRVALDFVRSSYYLEKRNIQSTQTAVSIQGSAPEMQRLEHIGLEQAVEKLEPHLKQVIDLQYFMGYTQQEVADETGLPLGTVKSRTRVALLRLRAQLSLF